MIKKELKITNGETILIKKIPYKHGEIISAHNSSGDEIGLVVFFLTDKHACWLQKISVKQSYFYLGVGQALLNAMESFLMDKGITNITGKFSPEGENVLNVKRFYNKNGYLLYGDQEQMYIEKTLFPSMNLDL